MSHAYGSLISRSQRRDAGHVTIRTAVVLALTLSLSVPAASAQTASGPDLAISVAVPGAPLAGETFTAAISVANEGTEAVTDSILSVFLPAELDLDAVPDGCTTDEGGYAEPVGAPPPEDPVAPDEGGGSAAATGADGRGFYGDYLTCSFARIDPAATMSVDLSVTRRSARAVYASVYVWSPAPETDYEDNYRDLVLQEDTSRPADIGIALTGPATPDVGAPYSYELTVNNAGPSTGEGIRVVVPAPYGATIDSAQPQRATDSCTSSEAGFACDIAALAGGESATVMLGATRTSAWDVYLSAMVTSFNHDTGFDNDYAWHQIAPDPSVVSDLVMKLDAPITTPLSGEVFQLRVAMRNDGPSGAGDVWANVWLPPEVRFVSADPSETCSEQVAYPYGPTDDAAAPGPEGDAYYPSFGGLWCSFGALAPGEEAQTTLTLERTGARETWISGWASTSNHDPNYDNNYFDLRLDPDKSHPADLAVTMSGPDEPAVDTEFTVAVDITNNGPDVASNVMLYDQLPWGADFVSASEGCTATTYYYPPYDGVEAPVWEGTPQVECALGSMEAGATRKVEITLRRTTEYELWNSASVTTSSWDSNWENDYAWLSLGGTSYEGDCKGGDAGGTDGSDTIVAGDCVVEAGEGADSISVTPSSSTEGTTVLGGTGPDSIDVDVRVGASAPRPIDVRAGGGDDTITIALASGTGAAHIVVNAGAGNDTVRLTIPPGLSDVTVRVLGRGGADRIEWISAPGPYPREGMIAFSGGGADIVIGGPGWDNLEGGRGSDRLFGGEGRDVLYGGRGPDVCRGGPARDTTKSC